MRRITLTLAAGAALALAACDGDKAGDEPAAAADENAPGRLVATLADTSGFSTVGNALKSTGVGTIFDDQGSYTLLAPNDEAFSKLGDAGKQLQAEGGGAALAALLRDHILTGYSTLDDIRAAVEAGGGKAALATVGGGSVIFTKDGAAIVAQSSDGARARLVGEAITGGNSLALPVDTVLKKI